MSAYPTLNIGDPYPFSTFLYYGLSGFGVRSDGHLTFIADGINWQETNVLIPLNKWVFYTFVFESNGVYYIYENGSLVVSGVTNSYAGSQFSVGAYENTARPLTGDITKVSVFNSALTPSDVTNLYTAANS